MFFSILANSTSSITDTIDEVGKVVNMEPSALLQYIEGQGTQILRFGIDLVVSLLIYVVGTRIIKLVRMFFRRFLKRTSMEAGVRQFIVSLLTTLLYVLLIVVVVLRLGVESATILAPILALLGTAGLALGLALQGSLSNFAGGVLILLLKPFKVGDYIIEHNRQCEGRVIEIQVFYTKLATLDNKVILIPNGSLSNNSMTNFTQNEKRRIEIVIGVSYRADIKKVKGILKQILEKEPDRLPDEPMTVFIQDLEDSRIRIGCQLWVSTDQFWPVRCRLIEEIKLALEENGIDPFGL